MALFNPSNTNKENKLYRHNFTHFHISLLRLAISTLCAGFPLLSFFFVNCTFSARILLSIIIDSGFICTRLSSGVFFSLCNCTCYFLLERYISFFFLCSIIPTICMNSGTHKHTTNKVNWKVRTDIFISIAIIIRQGKRSEKTHTNKRQI